MTIAIGLLCRDGIVMGADSQSGIAGSLKWPTQKILPITIGTHGNESTVNSAAIAVAGAGNTHYFQEMQELSARLIEVPDSANTIEEKLRSKFRDFYAETILPFSGTNGAPLIWMMFGVQKDNSVSLYTTEQMSFRENRMYAAIGSGEFVAKALIESSFPRYPPVAVARILMIYALQHVRDRVDGVGGNSSIVTLANNTCSFLDADAIREGERCFEKFRLTHAGLIQCLCGHLDESALDRVSEDSREIRTSLMAIAGD